ncbi:hypothetical protein Tco_0796247 [Tanacetum coccineum]
MSTLQFAETHNMIAFLEKPAETLLIIRRVIILEAAFRSDLHLEDAGGTDCLPTATIFEELARMGAKTTAWNEFSSIMASAIICLATNQKFNLSKYIFDAMAFLLILNRHPLLLNHHPLDLRRNSLGGNRGMKREVPKDVTIMMIEFPIPPMIHFPVVLDLEKAKDTQAKEIVDLKKRVQQLEREKEIKNTVLKD